MGRAMGKILKNSISDNVIANTANSRNLSWFLGVGLCVDATYNKQSI